MTSNFRARPASRHDGGSGARRSGGGMGRPALAGGGLAAGALRTAACLLLIATGVVTSANAQKILIPMDLKQTDHLKAYGIAYWALTKNIDVDWLLNYRGGSFMVDG